MWFAIKRKGFAKIKIDATLFFLEKIKIDRHLFPDTMMHT